VSSKTESPITSDRLAALPCSGLAMRDMKDRGARARFWTRGGGGARWLGVGRTSVECGVAYVSIWWDGGNVIGGPGRLYRFDSESVTLGTQAGTQI